MRGNEVNRPDGSGSASSASTGRRSPSRVVRFLGGVGAASMIGTFAVVPIAFTLLPVPAGADAVTLCFPGIGPLQQFSGDLSEELEEIVVVHERVHAEQCRSLGAAAWATRYQTLRGRIELEAEAFCAEIDHLAARGLDRDALLEPRVEILRHGYRTRDAYTSDEVREIMRSACDGTGGTSRVPDEREG